MIEYALLLMMISFWAYAGLSIVGKATNASFGQVNNALSCGSATCSTPTNCNAYAWGANAVSQLGNGGGADQHQPTAVSGGHCFTAIAGGDGSAAALASDGTVWTWGDNTYGQLGNGSVGGAAANVPYHIASLTSVVQVVSGGYHVSVLKSDGTVWSWGSNQEDELGNGVGVATLASSGTPVQVVSLPAGVTSIAAGTWNGLAVASGQIYIWGNAANGQLGNNTIPQRTPTPQVVPTFTNVASAQLGYLHVLVMKTDGSIYIWGNYYYSATNCGTNFPMMKTPTSIAIGGGTAAQIAAGGNHDEVLKADGTVWGWGYNANNQLLATSLGCNYTSATQAQNLPALKTLFASWDDTMAILPSGGGIAWGWGSNGILGNGTCCSDTTTNPVTISTLTGIKTMAGSTTQGSNANMFAIAP